MWGESGKNYSKEVIRSYICKRGLILQRRPRRRIYRFNTLILAAIHAGGSSEFPVRDNLQFARRVEQQLVANGKLNLVYVHDLKS